MGCFRSPFIEGVTLDERVARAQPSRDEVVGLTLQLLDHVGKLRAAGIAHRDLHPANVIIDPAGVVHLIDFGWAVMANWPDLSPSGLGSGVILPATRTSIDIRPPEAAGDDLFAIGRITGWMNRAQEDPELQFFASWLGHPDHRLRLNDVGLARQLLLRVAQAPADDQPRLEGALLKLARGALKEVASLDQTRVALQRERDGLHAERRRQLEELTVAQGRTREVEQALRRVEVKSQEGEQAAAAAQHRVQELEQALRRVEVKSQEGEQAAEAAQRRVQEVEQALRRVEVKSQEGEQATEAAQRRVQELEQALETARQESQALKGTIDFVNRSRFWKARNLWFTGKRALGVVR